MVELASELQTPAPRLVRSPRSKNHKIKKSLVDKPKLIDGTSETLRAPAHLLEGGRMSQTRGLRSPWFCSSFILHPSSFKKKVGRRPKRPCPTLRNRGGLTVSSRSDTAAIRCG